jgi:prefoldin subunit 5
MEAKQMSQDTDKALADIQNKIEELSKEVKGFNTRFSDYQQATQWVVQLAFALIGSATVTVIITTVFKK